MESLKTIIEHTQRQQIEVIRVGEADVPMLYELLEWRRTGDDTETPPQQATHDHKERKQTLAIMRDHVRSENLFIWGARFDKHLVGYISVAKIIKPDPRVYFYIDELWIPKPFRRHGIAFCLLQKTIQTAKAMNMWRIRMVSNNTSAARGLYRKAGFEIDEQSGWSELKLDQMT